MLNQSSAYYRYICLFEYQMPLTPEQQQFIHHLIQVERSFNELEPQNQHLLPRLRRDLLHVIEAVRYHDRDKLDRLAGRYSQMTETPYGQRMIVMIGSAIAAVVGAGIGAAVGVAGAMYSGLDVATGAEIGAASGAASGAATMGALLQHGLFSTPGSRVNRAVSSARDTLGQEDVSPVKFKLS